MLDQKSLPILYNSLVLPYLTYCVEVWGNTYPSSLQRLLGYDLRGKLNLKIHIMHYFKKFLYYYLWSKTVEQIVCGDKTNINSV